MKSKISLLLLIVLAFGCKKEPWPESCKTIPCEAIELGQLLLLEESIEEGMIYKAYDHVFFENENGDSLVFAVEYQDTTWFFSTSASGICPEDPSRSTRVEYQQQHTSQSLQKVSEDANTTIDKVNFLLRTLLNHENANEGLFGDFMNVNVKFRISPTTTSIHGIYRFPVNLRSFADTIEEDDFMKYHEELMINGQLYNDVFESKHSGSEVIKLYYTVPDGLLWMEETDGTNWYYVGKE